MHHEALALVILITAFIAAAAFAVVSTRHHRRQQSASLRQKFGPEYERALAEHGDQTRAERELLQRQKRLEKLHIQLLSPEQCQRFGAAWGHVQQRFVDDPEGAVRDADALVKEAMSARGYPMGDFEQRVADLSVEHANVVDHYRAARAIALASANGQADTEELRQAMVHYRALFSDLLQAERAPGAAIDADLADPQSGRNTSRASGTA